MFTPDREPHPAVSEIKFLMQPVVFEPVEKLSVDEPLRIVVTRKQADLRLTVKNRYVFSNLSHLTWSWQLTSNRSVDPMQSGSFELQAGKDYLVLKLNTVVSRVVQLEKTRPAHGNRYFLNIRGVLRSATTWANAGHVLVTQQFPIEFVFETSISQNCVDKDTRRECQLNVKSDDWIITVSRVQNQQSEPLVVIEKATGALVSYAPQGKNLLAGRLLPNFTRAATDNDKGGMELTLNFMFPTLKVDGIFAWFHGWEEFSFWSHWKRVELDQAMPPSVTCTGTDVLECNGGQRIDVTAHCSVVQAVKGNEIFRLLIEYSVFGDGDVRITHQVSPQALLQRTTSLPRIGMQMQLDSLLYQVCYFGRGPGENYPDRKSGSEMGVYATTPVEMGYNKYVVPGENGSRSDCEWIAFRSDSDGDGLCVVSGETPFSCSALLYSATELHSAEHTRDLPKRANGRSPVFVSLDHKLMGVGGDNRYVLNEETDFFAYFNSIS